MDGKGTISLLVLTVGLAAVSCKNSGSGEALWKKACAHAYQLAAEGKTEGDERKKKIEYCLKTFRKMKRSAADRTARCVLTKKSEEDIEACAPKELKERYEEREKEMLTRVLLKRYKFSLELHYINHSKHPPDLKPLKMVKTKDGWGNPLRYKLTPKGFKLCSDGPDGKAGTGDDICVTQAESKDL